MNSIIETLPATDRPLSREAFEKALCEPAAFYRFDQTRMYRLISSGRCPRPLLRRWARSACRTAEVFCPFLAELAETAPDREARLLILENLMEEEGIFLSRTRGLVVRPDQRHVALAMRFVRACGGEEDGGPADDVIHSLGPARTLLAEGRWLEAVSFALIGQELGFATTCTVMFHMLRKVGFSERELVFFAIHGEADCAHGRQALDIVIDRALTAEAQRRCLAAAERGARYWFDNQGAYADRRRAA